MKKTLRLISVAIILLALVVPLFMTSGIYATSTIQEYLNTGGDANSADIYGDNICAMQFTSNATAHTVTSIRLNLLRVGNPGTVTVALRNAAAGVPSTTANLTSGTLNGNNLGLAYAWREIDVTDISINASTQYAIIVSAENGDNANYVQWHLDSGGGLANAVASHSTDAGISWTSDTPADALFEIWGSTVLSIESAAVFQTYLATGDILVTAEVINVYPPYATIGNPQEFFQLQLIALDTTTILASTPFTAWGDKPQSVYLSASSASALTIGAAYIVRVHGTFSGAPADVDYTLTPADWYGSDLIWLDEWMRTTAHNLDTYYNLSGSSSLTQFVTNSGEILTDTGGAIFTNAIPGISQVRPNMFVISKSKPQFTVGTNGNTYDAGQDYKVILGAEVSGDLDTWGTLFSMSGNNFGGWTIGLIIGGILIIGLILGGKAGVPLLLVGGLPILFIGNYTGLIGIQWTVIFAVAMVIYFTWSFYFSRT